MTRSTDLSDRELYRIRLRFLDLLKSFFQDEPDAERLGRWRGFFSALAGESIHPALDEAVTRLTAILATTDLEKLRAEYYRLFIDPFSEELLPMQASWYLDGHSHGPSLASYRAFLQEARIVRQKGVTEAEDSLVLMLDALTTLIDTERRGGGPTGQLQRTLVQDYLLPLGRNLRARLAGQPAAPVYTACLMLLCGYLELEEDLLTLTATDG